MLNFSINSIVWGNNIINWSPGCNHLMFFKASYVEIASQYGAQLAILCIARRITSQKIVRRSHVEIRRDLTIELFIGIGIPLLLLPLYYVVQARSFMTPITFPLVIIWLPIFALICAVYFGFSIYHLARQQYLRRQLFGRDEYVESKSYWRLMTLAGAQIALAVPDIYGLVNAFQGPMAPYNWDAIHSDFSVPLQASLSYWIPKISDAVLFEWERWYYRGIFLAILRPFRYLSSTMDSDDLEASNKPPARPSSPRNLWSKGSLRFFRTSDISISAKQIASHPPIPSSPSCLLVSSDE
ncbi:hypothetical protein SERLADRAFT_412530 [Serpula lacrymans var. lacrymans S7.9]|uniref:Uncharacterized protein n=1 Tax=Serpula lacrymans var. lacrymans (strain S7.9) TaxID=578457 RepID=F8NG92_SERL9|nr:uncharacterized protein SERLADRAFT_412530 [Serpula lacrymans var. lacrymans S7.9]EGO31061.1 hypothetical protein SERLADRAFT_412530 [Serpula lacrymans var. lacrymans S7.9]